MSIGIYDETLTQMQYLFNVTAFFHNTPVFYRISQISQYEYHAEPTDKEMKSFKFKKCLGTWMSEGGYTEWQALQIGVKIDKVNLYSIKN